MKIREIARVGAASLLLALISACGGGGGGGDAPPPAAQPTAIPDNLAITAPPVTEPSGATAFTSTAAGLSGLSFVWSFGDGTSSTEASPRHDYAKAGDFEVGLKVSNAAGTSKEVKFRLAVNNRTLVQGLSCSGDNQGGWCWQAPRPSGNLVNDSFFLSAQQGWTVGDNGEIHKTSDGGKTWTRQFTGIATPVTTVRFADADNGWALGAYGAVLHTTDGGTHWTLQNAVPLDTNVAKITAVNASTAIITASYNQSGVTSDGGATWSPVNLSSYAMLSVAPDGTIWAVSYESLSKSTDLGKTWTVMRTWPSQQSGYPTLVVKGALVLLAQQNFVYDPLQGGRYVTTFQRSGDGGVTWETLSPLGLPAGFFSFSGIDFSDASVGSFAVNSDLYRTTDGARTWTKTAEPPGVGSGYADQRLLLPGVRYRGYYDTSYKYSHQISEDNGISWRNVAVPARYSYGSWQVQKLQRVDAQTWVALSDSAVWVSTDGMASWSVVRGQSSTQAPRNFSALWFQDASRGLAMSQYGELLETRNGGQDWAVKLSGLPNDYGFGSRLQFIDAHKGWLQTADGKLYISTDGGEGWSAPLTPQNFSFRNVQFLDASIGFALVIDSASNYQRRLLASTDGGLSWTPMSALTGDFQGLHFTSAQQGVMVGYGGRIISTTDGGKTWVGRFSGTDAVLSSVAQGETGLWAVGDRGVMLNSKDGGVTWTLTPPMTMANLRKVRFLDTRQGWIVGNDGVVLATQDGGKTWKPQNTGSRASLSDVFFTDSRSGWVSGEGGTLLVTGTGGQ